MHSCPLHNRLLHVAVGPVVPWTQAFSKATVCSQDLTREARFEQGDTNKSARTDDGNGSYHKEHDEMKCSAGARSSLELVRSMLLLIGRKCSPTRVLNLRRGNLLPLLHSHFLSPGSRSPRPSERSGNSSRSAINVHTYIYIYTICICICTDKHVLLTSYNYTNAYVIAKLSVNICISIYTYG